MSDTSFIRFISGIFDFVEKRVVPAFVRMRNNFSESVAISEKKLDFSPVLYPLVHRWYVWSHSGSFGRRFFGRIVSFLLEAFVLLLAAACMLCILYFIW